MNEQKLTGAGIICYIDNTKGLIESLEKDYLFKYHIYVYEKLSKYLASKERKWLATFI